MKINIISAYLGHRNEVIAIAPQSYFILNASLDKEKAQMVVDKVNQTRAIEVKYWTEKKCQT